MRTKQKIYKASTLMDGKWLLQLDLLENFEQFFSSLKHKKVSIFWENLLQKPFTIETRVHLTYNQCISVYSIVRKSQNQIFYKILFHY